MAICNMHFKTDFYVYGENPTKVTQAVNSTGYLHKELKDANISNTECESNAANAVCKAAFPDCSKDRTKIVWLLYSKQDCREIVGSISKYKPR